MKIKNRIEEEEEEAHKIEILIQNSNSVLLGVYPWIDWLFSLPWSSPVEEQWNLCKKKEQKWKEEEKWRIVEKKREKRVWS